MTRRFVFFLLSLTMMACGAASPNVGTDAAALAPTCTTIQRGLAGTVIDASVRSDQPTTPNGNGTSITASVSGTTVRHALLQWDLSTLPAGAEVTSATIGLWPIINSGAPVVFVRPNTSAWTESGVTWNTAPSYGTSLGTVPSGTSVIVSTSIPVSTAQGWISGATNFGVTLEANASGGQESVMASETATLSQRPSLRVCYVTCSNASKDGPETDVDCGGGICAPCANGKLCSVAADCSSGICTAGACAAPNNGCANGILDNAETDIDCGGGTCPTCGPYKRCLVLTDCRGGVCTSGTCAATCSDGVQNQDETDVDCGGATCSRCSQGLHCTVTSDCAMGFACSAGTCSVTTPCNNGVKDGAETDIDCGGGTCAACATGKTCAVPADCSTAACGNAVCVPYGVESTVVLSTCSRTPDNSLYPTTYSYGAAAADLIDVWLPPGGCGGGCAINVNVHGGGGTGDGGGSFTCPLGDHYAPTCAFCGGSPNPCTGADPTTIVHLTGRQTLAYFCRTVAGNLNGITPIACAAIDYSLMTGHYPSTVNAYPTQANEGLAAHAWVLSNAASLGVNPARVSWTGYSFGGHVAAKVAELAPSAPAHIALDYSNLYFDDPTWWAAYNPSGYDYLGCAIGDASCVASRSAVVNARPRIGVPVLLTHGSLDTTINPASSVRYRDAARSMGINATEIVDAVGHGACPTCMGPSSDATCTSIFKWAQQ